MKYILRKMFWRKQYKKLQQEMNIFIRTNKILGYLRYEIPYPKCCSCLDLFVSLIKYFFQRHFICCFLNFGPPSILFVFFFIKNYFTQLEKQIISSDATNNTLDVKYEYVFYRYSSMIVSSLCLITGSSFLFSMF